MKKRVIACLLALTMVFSNVVPAMAEPETENTAAVQETEQVQEVRGFQDTIDWLYEHSSEIGYEEISETAKSMKNDFSILAEKLEADAEIIEGLLNTYIKVRSRQESLPETMETSVSESADRLWQYFTQAMSSVGGTVKSVEPKLQVRGVAQSDGEIVLDVYEWVYMTYEMDGATDISACGFTHQITFKSSEDGWKLSEDAWEDETVSQTLKGSKGTASADAEEEDKEQASEEAEETKEAVPDSAGDADKEQDSDTGQESPEKPAAEESGSEDGASSENAEDPDTGENKADLTEQDSEENVSEKTDADETVQQPDSQETSGVSDIIEADEIFTEDEAEDQPSKEEGESEAEDQPVQEETGSEAEDQSSQEITDETKDQMTEETAEESTEVEYLPEGETEIPDDLKKEEDYFIPAQEEDIQKLTEAIPEEISLFSLTTQSISLMTAAAPVSFTYDYKKAVAYAEQYAMNYNPAYNNYNSVGGDCANFVSQCLYAGGLPMTDGWMYQKTVSWTYASSLYSYLAENCGTAITNPAASNIRAGDPVFYYSSSQGRYSHAAICVGVNASNVPVVDAHNTDHLHAVWTLGTSWSKRAVIQIKTNTASSTVEAPEISASDPAEGETWKITASSLVLRSGAGTSYEKLTSVPKGTSILVTDKASVGAQTWAKTTYNGYTGWVCIIYDSNTAYAAYVSGHFDDVPVTKVALDKTSASLSGAGSTVTLKATVTPVNATLTTLSWTSSNNAVAKVSSSGVVTAVAAGSAVITAQALDGSGKSATCVVTVTIPVKSITLDKTSATLTSAGASTVISVKSYSPSNAGTKAVTWSSSNTKVATVDSSGKVTAVANGTATITATAKDGKGAKATCKVTVNIPISEKWKITATSLTMRSKASTSGAKLGKYVPKGTTVTVTQKSTTGTQTWGKVTYGGKTGWICLIYSSKTAYATKVSTATGTAAAPTTTATVSGSEQWKITASTLRMRSSASTSGKYLGKSVPKGTKVTVTQKKSVGVQTWGYVTYGGKTGWICLIYNSKTSYAAKVASSSSTASATTTTTTGSSSSEKWKITASALLMRSSASTSGTYLGKTVPKGTTVTVTQKKTNGAQTWGYVTYGGKKGWICLIYSSKTSYAKKQ